ncbi:PREDICTED: uncharacterized protein LOC104813901 [Tarenaya hassleriana]|uniref:uncharacterized protein LOC104813901 n=1 Tax=Tarenaya hassleriana TaxID=28532 RepID=UPI00053C2F64|nr:PREDICTED: uncharacterized protein LOC104813901 [Tarenaya hassleriana]
MALTVSSGVGGAGIRCINLSDRSRTPSTAFRHVNVPGPTRARHVATAAKKTSQTGRFDSKKRRSLVNTPTKEQPEEEPRGDDENPPPFDFEGDGGGGDRTVESISGKAPPIRLSELPGVEPDFWEGPQWDALGFFFQYLWAFGIVFALISGGIAVATYNEGATDFKKTPVYKEAIQSRDLIDEAEGSSSEEVFESNPTEVAPSLE